MGNTWLRLNADWRRHPRLRMLDWFEQTVLMQIWCVAKGLGRGGLVPNVYLDAAFLADEIGCGEKHIADISEAVASAKLSGLLETTEEGVTVRDWGQYQKDPGSTDRVRRHRERKRDSKTLAADVTLQTVTETKGNDVTDAVPSRPVPSRSVSDLLSPRKDPPIANPQADSPRRALPKGRNGNALKGWAETSECWLLAYQVRRLRRARGLPEKSKGFQGKRDLQRIRSALGDMSPGEVNGVLWWSAEAPKDGAQNWYEEVVMTDHTAALGPKNIERNLEAARQWQAKFRATPTAQQQRQSSGPGGEI